MLRRVVEGFARKMTGTPGEVQVVEELLFVFVLKLRHSFGGELSACRLRGGELLFHLALQQIPVLNAAGFPKELLAGVLCLFPNGSTLLLILHALHCCSNVGY